MYRPPSSRRGETVVEAEGAGLLPRLYKAYYSLRPPIEAPDRIERREFAFQPFDTDSYVRHISFSSEDELLDYLAQHYPRQAYYSVAIYELPEARNMEEKMLVEADLFFDIDVDHLEGCEGPLPGDDCLMKGLEAAARIVRIARRDLGAESAYTYYTGNRGFHVIVSCERCSRLGREERREIAYYFAAEGLDPGAIFPRRPPKGYEPAVPDAGDPGWRGWIALGVPPGSQSLVEAFGPEWRSEVSRLAVEMAAPIDFQVTQDPTRLSRIRGTLNGKASLLAVPVGRGWRPYYRELSPFTGYVDVEFLEEISGVRMLGYSLHARKGETASVPAQIAVMLQTKGAARILGGEIVVRAYTGWRAV